MQFTLKERLVGTVLEFNSLSSTALEDREEDRKKIFTSLANPIYSFGTRSRQSLEGLVNTQTFDKLISRM